MFEADSEAVFRFLAQQSSNEIAAEKEKDGYTEAAGQISVRHRMSNKYQQEGDGTHAIEGGNVDGLSIHVAAGLWEKVRVASKRSQVSDG